VAVLVLLAARARALIVAADLAALGGRELVELGVEGVELVNVAAGL
jgi:hypothetical protein